MTVNVVEPLGSDMDVYMDTGKHNHVVARVEARSDLRAGSVVRLYVDLKRVHFFEPGETGMNLSLSKEPAHAIA
jgi:multiple sugar transport system ATP-binding protein